MSQSDRGFTSLVHWAIMKSWRQASPAAAVTLEKVVMEWLVPLFRN